MTSPRDVDPEFETELVMHQRIIESGKRQVVTPVLFALAATCVGTFVLGALALEVLEEPWVLLGALLAFGGGFVVSWRLHYRLLEPWYRNALAKGADPALLHDFGVEGKLFHPPESFFGRREAPPFAKIRRAMALSPSDRRK